MDNYTAIAYLNNRYFGVMDTFEGDYGEVIDLVWEWLNQGYYVECNGYDGKVRFNPDILNKLLESYDYVELTDCIDD